MASKMAGKKVGDYVRLQRGTTYSGSLVGRPGPALLGLGSIVPGGGFRSDHFKTFGGECPAKLMLGPGDLYVALKGATKDGSMVGSVARVPRDIPAGRLTQDTARLDFLQCDRELMNHLYWILRTPQYRNYCEGRLTGSASASFSRVDFLNYPVPPITQTSKAIVGVLEAVEDKVELNRRTHQTLEAMARTLFKGWFVDFEPVRAKAEGLQPEGIETSLSLLFPGGFQMSSLGKIPKGWSVATFGDYTESVKGLSYKGDGLSESGFPLHNLNSVYEGGGYKYEGIKYYVGEYKPRHLLTPGDVIVTNTEQGHDLLLIGFPAIVPRRFGDVGLFSHHIYRVRPKPESPLTNHFIYLQLMNQRFRDEVTGYTNGTTVNMLSVDGLQRPLFVVPPKSVIQEFERQIGPLFEKQEQLHEESPLLERVRAALLAKLLSGEIRVPDAERILAKSLP